CYKILIEIQKLEGDNTSWLDFHLWNWLKLLILKKLAITTKNPWLKNKAVYLLNSNDSKEKFTGSFKKDNSVIYALISPSTKKFYIGETKDFKTRIETHFRQVKK